jgi:23S rRNA (guanosine2251-2'-O)-methyltransferase
MRRPTSLRTAIGIHSVTEALRANSKSVVRLTLRKDWESSSELRSVHALASRANIKIEIKPVGALDKIYNAHQGVVLELEGQPEFDLEKIAQNKNAVLLGLDGLEDPHNLGAIMRTSWLMGVNGLFIPSDRAVGLTATVHKIACGGAEHVPVVTVNQFAPHIEEIKQAGFWVFGLSGNAKKTIFEFKAPEKVMFFIGSEEKGLRSTTEKICDELISIPQLSKNASYNASVATAIALTETVRQHRLQSL